MYIRLIFIFVFSFSFSFVIEVDGEKYSEQDFFSKYSKAEWDGASDEQKKRMLLDYIKRESCKRFIK